MTKRDRQFFALCCFATAAGIFMQLLFYLAFRGTIPKPFGQMCSLAIGTFAAASVFFFAGRLFGEPE